MGSGDFGSNGSVHWNVRHTPSNSGQVPGPVYGNRDPIPFDDIGRTAGHLDSFRLTLKFPDEGIARAALTAALASVQPNGYATLDVPKVQPKRSSPVPPEISIDW